jgi:predicted nucleic acid-binding protein
MSGVRFLLDTNFVLGMLKASPAVMGVLGANPPLASKCGYSAVTRMELLGFQGITPEEDSLIRTRLVSLRYFPIDRDVEDAAIALRRQRKIKLPDALIAATAWVHQLDLLTLDEGLRAVVTSTNA